MQLLLLMTDMLVMFLSKWRHDLGYISVRCEAKRSIKKSLQIISIKETVSSLPKVAVDNLLFIHTWNGPYHIETSLLICGACDNGLRHERVKVNWHEIGVNWHAVGVMQFLVHIVTARPSY